MLVLNVESTPRNFLTFKDFKKLGILKLEDRVKQLEMNHVHKIFYGQCPSYMNENFTKISDVHSYRTRKHDYSFYVPNVNNVLSTTFYYNGITTWNSLPEEVLSIKNHTRLKKEVKKYLLSLNE